MVDDEVIKVNCHLDTAGGYAGRYAKCFFSINGVTQESCKVDAPPSATAYPVWYYSVGVGDIVEVCTESVDIFAAGNALAWLHKLGSQKGMIKYAFAAEGEQILYRKDADGIGPMEPTGNEYIRDPAESIVISAEDGALVKIVVE